MKTDKRQIVVHLKNTQEKQELDKEVSEIT